MTTKTASSFPHNLDDLTRSRQTDHLHQVNKPAAIMSNLCYNCGSFHMPYACPQNLRQCEICFSFGHMLHFCPRSVQARIPEYAYTMLCHNCEIWHLPLPCRSPLHQCGRCGHYGHLEYFCPVNPLEHIIQAFERNMMAAAAQREPALNHQLAPVAGQGPYDPGKLYC